MMTSQSSSKTSLVASSWFRDKKVSFPQRVYERARRGEVFWILDLRGYFEVLDSLVQGRRFKQSSLVVLLVLKIFNVLFYRTFASFSEQLRFHEFLGEERALSYIKR